MYSEFAADPKVQSMSEPFQRRLVMLFCLRSSDVLVTLRERDIAFALRVTEQELSDTKRVFIDRGFIDEEWKVLNWSKRQFVSDSSTERTRAYRERMRTSQERHCDALDTDTDTDTEQKHKEPSPKSGSGTAHGSRFSLDEVPLEWQEWSARELHWSAERAEKIFAIFGDYWRAQPGAKGRKTDWLATWRNWCKREDNSPPRLNGMSVVRESATDRAIRIGHENIQRTGRL